MDAVLCRKQETPDYIISISIFALIYMNWKVGNFINGKIEEKKF